MKITEALLAEHVVFHNIFDHLESRIPKLKTLGEVRALAALLESLLEAHSAAEDELLLAPLEHYIEQIGQHSIFHQEHEAIDENLARVREVRLVKQAKRHLLAAVLASRHHFDKEERVIFPLAERSLKAKSLINLGHSWLHSREAR
ncbi:MAG: hypothetical protein FJ404_17770 [Verrucomicrobia bacterium]|nr:hypothetical protein [Verrucomicrobiota bacterium]